MADRSGTTLPAASRNHPKKMYHAALAGLSPGIGSPIGSADNTPTIARQPATTNRAMLGARKFMEASQAIFMHGPSVTDPFGVSVLPFSYNTLLVSRLTKHSFPLAQRAGCFPMLERILGYCLWELRTVGRAPVALGAALLAVVLIAVGAVWHFRQETTSLRQQLSEYRDKLGGASPDEAKTALDALADEVTALQARLQPRRVNAYQRQIIADRLKVPSGTQYALAIVHEGGCWDCPQYAADFDGTFRSVPGWMVSNRVAMGLMQRPPRGVAVVVLDPFHPSAQEAVLLQALQAAGIEFDLQGARSPLDKGIQLLLAAKTSQ